MRILAEVVDRSRVLDSLVAYAHEALPAAIAAIEFRFADGTLCLAVDPNTDQIEARWDVSTRMSSTQLPHSLTSALLGKRVQFAWRLRNNLGYDDAIQLQFVSDSGGDTIVIQVIALASTLRILAVLPWEDAVSPLWAPASRVRD